MKDRLWISTFLFVISFRGEWSTSVGGKSEHECQLPRLLHRGVGGRVRVGNKEVGHCWNLGDSCLLISLLKNCSFSRIFVLAGMTAKCPLSHCLANISDFTLKLLFYLFHTCSSITNLQQVWYLMSFDPLTFQVCWRSLTEKGKYFSLKTKMNTSSLLPLNWLNKRS